MEIFKSLMIVVAVILIAFVIMGALYLYALGVTHLACLGASYFVGDIRTFFLIFYGVSLLVGFGKVTIKQ